MDSDEKPIELYLGDDSPDPRPESQELLKRIKSALPQLEALYEDLDHQYEDRFYRYYHGSFKLYALQTATLKVVAALEALCPGRPLNDAFSRIVSEGTGLLRLEGSGGGGSSKERHILEAFFHARSFLEMAIRYGKSLEFAPSWLPTGWASVLYLFNLRLDRH